MTQYSYAPVDQLDVANGGTPDAQAVGFNQPRVIAERVLGALTSLTYRSLRATVSGHEEIEERCPRPSSSFGDGSCLRTETRYYAENYGAANSGKVASVVHPDGRLDSYEYERGTTIGASFSAGEGQALRTTVTHGTVRSPGGVPNKSTREVSIVDEHGRAVRDEQYIHGGTGYVLASWTERQYDGQGRAIGTTHSTGESESSSWGCCSENSSTDSRGIRTVYDRDDLQRVRSSTRAGVTTTYVYDAEGRELQATRSGGGLSLTSGRHYDGAGRVDTSTDEAGLVTTYVYAPGGRVSSVTRPGGATEVTEQYADGQVKSVTGAAVVSQYYSYAVQGDGTRVTEVRTARPDSPMFERTYTDMLGRTIRTERPGFSALEVATTQYNERGRAVSSTSTGSAATLYEYDELGEQVRSGQDVNGNGTLDLSSNDRITESSTQFVAVDGAYWQESSQRVYVEAGSSETKTTGVSRTRLTGLGGGLVSDQLSIDLYGNETRSTVRVDPGSTTETRTVDTPDSVQNAITVSVAGRLVSSTTATGLTTTYGYDGLGRRTSTTDPRTGASETHYDAQGRVDYVKDAAGNPTSFGYDPVTGRKIRETNVLGNHSYFAYNPRRQLTRTWGDVPYPVQYGYDGYGRRKEMTTYRVEAGWSSPTWPESATGDTTRWHYQESTGLLLSKEDAAGKAVTYTYGPAGHLATRTWARKKPDGTPLVTSYAYDAATGELRAVDYNDNTPDVTHSFDRLGRQTAVSDGVGTRVFAYDPLTLQLKTETIDGLTPAEITRYYDPALAKGRSVGIGLGNNYLVGYGHDEFGRIMSVGWTANGSTDTAIYSRVEQSELLAGYVTASRFTSRYGYEPKRDLKTLVSNSFGGSTVSKYDYRYDRLGRRISVENSGTAFVHPTRFTSWGYDERNQVTGSNRHTGAFASTQDPANEIARERRTYDYDPTGNRKSALDEDGITSIGYTANELNQYDVIAQRHLSYDEDGNLLSDGRKVLTYNAENQLKSVMVPAESVSTYSYDYRGRRVQKSVHMIDGSSGDYVVTWVYNGWNRIQESKRVGIGVTSKNFVWGLDLSQSMEGAGGIGGLVAVVAESGNASLFAYDGNGNVSELLEHSSGSILAHYEYDASGNTVLASGVHARENCFRFSTREQDDESGQYYFGYRYLNTDLGRWTQRDPIGESGAALTRSFHPYVWEADGTYRFVDGNPVSFIDSHGLKITFTQQAMSFDIKLGFGFGFGKVHAVSDCHKGVFYDENYIVTSFQLSLGVGFSAGKSFEAEAADAAVQFANRMKDAAGDTFVLENAHVPPASLTWLDVDTLKVGLLIGEFNLASVKSSVERLNRNDSKTFELDWGKLGISVSAASIGRTLMWLERDPVPRSCCRGM